jgi:hypothetical protein
MSDELTCLNCIIIFMGIILGLFAFVVFVERPHHDKEALEHLLGTTAQDIPLTYVPPSLFRAGSLVGQYQGRTVTVQLTSIASREWELAGDEGGRKHYQWTAITVPVRNPQGYFFIFGKHLGSYILHDVSSFQAGTHSYQVQSWPNGFAQHLFSSEQCGQYLDSLPQSAYYFELKGKHLSFRELGSGSRESLRAVLPLLNMVASSIEAQG